MQGCDAVHVRLWYDMWVISVGRCGIRAHTDQHVSPTCRTTVAHALHHTPATSFLSVGGSRGWAVWAVAVLQKGGRRGPRRGSQA